MSAPERDYGRLLEEALLGRALEVVLVVPYGTRAIQLRLPREVAGWLRDELINALGEPKPRPRRQPRLRRGRWINIQPGCGR